MLARVDDDLAAALSRGYPVEVALAWARRNVGVVPIFGIDEDGSCQCSTGSCPHAGKHPVPEYAPHGARSATTDLGFLIEVYKDRPSMNVGLALGRSLVCVDIDPRHGGDVAADYGLPRTFRELSGGLDGGAHDFFRTPARLRQATTRIEPGVTLLGDGALVVVAPSRHVSGLRYRPVDPSAPLAWLPHAFRVPVPAIRARALATFDPALADPTVIRRILDAAVRAHYGDKLKQALLTGADPGFRDWTKSGISFNCARLLARQTRDDNVIAAILLDSKLPRPKQDDARWLAKHLYDARHWTRPHPVADSGTPSPDDTRRQAGAHSAPWRRPSGAPQEGQTQTIDHAKNRILPTAVITVAGAQQLDTSRGLAVAVLGVIQGMAAGAHVGEGGWLPLPVKEVAAACGANRSSVYRALVRLSEARAIDTWSENLPTTSGAVRGVRWVRLSLGGQEE